MTPFRIGRSLAARIGLIAAAARYSLASTLRSARPAIVILFVLAGSACRDATAPPSSAVGGVEISQEGLPDGATGAVVLRKGRSARIASTSETVDGLDVGAWTMDASNVVVNGTTYEPSPASSTVNITSRSLGSARVVWTPTSGSIQLAVLGLPPGVVANVMVSSSSAARTITASSVVSGLPPGLYTIVVRDVRAPDGTMRGDVASQTVSVTASAVPIRASVTYRPAPSAVAVTVSGLSAMPARLTLISPLGVSAPIGESTRLAPVAAGRWQLLALAVQANGFTYTPTPTVHDTVVSAGDTLRLPVNYTLTSGALAIAMTGLPVGAAGSARVSGPNGYDRLVTSTTTLTDLAPGLYLVSADSVVRDGLAWRPSLPSQQITVSASMVAAPATVAYAAVIGTLVVTMSGVPNGASGSVRVQGPHGVDRTVTTNTVLAATAAGPYTIAAAPFTAGGFTYTVTPASVNRTVAIGGRDSVDLRYVALTGSALITVNGLPNGTAAAITLTGNAQSLPITGSTTLPTLPVGPYTLTAAAVNVGGTIYAPSPPTQNLAITTGAQSAATVTYSLTSGALAIAMTGLPIGATGSARVTGPNGFDRIVTATVTFTDLTPGTYTVVADSVVRNGVAWRPAPSSQPVTVTASLVAAPATIAYTAVTGTLVVTISGVPNGASGSVRVLGPYGLDRTVTTNTVLTSTAAGPYTIAAASFAAGGFTYAVTPASVNRTVAIGGRDSVDLRYVALTGSALITVNGLPNGTAAALTLTGNAQSLPITGSTTLPTLPVGPYTLTAAAVTVSGTNYVPTPTTQNFTVSNGAQSSATVTYAAVVTSGSLHVTVNGLPNGTNGALSLSNGTTTLAITGTTTLAGLTAGNYTLTANAVSASGTTYNPTPTSQNITITNGAPSAATVTYAGVSALIDLVIDQAYVTQATQKLDGSLALVAGRDALLRVFARADRANTATPTVRALIYDGATLLQTVTLTGPAGGVPIAVTEGTLSSSWNTIISGTNVRTAMRILVDIDPTNTVAEGNEANNNWPVTGTPRNLSVNAVPAFNVRLVPVTVGSLTGNVSASNMNAFLTTTRLQWPVGTINADVRAPFTSSADTITSNDSNGDWLTVLSEINSLRSADGAPATMHYYGVMKVAYGSGIAGYGYVPGRAAIGWDYLPSGDGVAAHEWGHNFNRPHAPCGGVSSSDPTYPYADGSIGAFGWNSTTGALLPTTHKDLMGYCSPSWVSDYNWGRVMTYRQSAGAVADAPVNGAGLLVWGRIVNGTVLLEPAFRITAPRSATSVRPTHMVEALDADGNVLLELPISADRVDHVTERDERHFAAVVPWTATLEDALTRLRVRDLRSPLVAATRASASAVAERRVRGTPRLAVAMPDPQVVTDAAPAGRVRVRWDQSRYPMAMVRDAASGQIMGYVRQSGDGVVSGGRRLEVVLSDGVRSVVKPAN